MPRVLPWQQSATKPKASGSKGPKRERAQSDSDEDLLDDHLNPTRPTEPEPKRVARTSSASPAARRLPKLEVAYMEEGWDKDDIFMMVEDEFETLLRATTAAYHCDELEAAKERMKHSIPGDHVHYTDGKTKQPKVTQLSLEADEKERMINQAMELDDSDDEIDDPHLAGLMNMPIRPTQDLTRFAKVQSSTRAAAGYQKSPEKPKSTTDVPVGTPESSLADYGSADESDDLDRPMRSQPVLRPAIKTESLNTNLPKVTAPVSKSSSIFAQFAKQANDIRAISIDSSEDSAPARPIKAEPGSSKSPKMKQERLHSDGNRLPSIKTAPESSSQSFMARRRAERERRRKDEEAKTNEKVELEVPTFMI